MGAYAPMQVKNGEKLRVICTKEIIDQVLIALISLCSAVLVSDAVPAEENETSALLRSKRDIAEKIIIRNEAGKKRKYPKTLLPVGVFAQICQGDIIDKGERIARELTALYDRISDLEKEKKELNDLIPSLLPWEEYSEKLSLIENKNICICLGTLPIDLDIDTFTLSASENGMHVRPISFDLNNHYIRVLYHKDGNQGGMDFLSQNGFKKAELEHIDMSAKNAIVWSRKRLISIDGEYIHAWERANFLEQELDTLKLYCDIMDTMLLIEKVKTCLSYTKTCVAFDIVLPLNKVDSLMQGLEKYECAIERFSRSEDEGNSTIIVENAIQLIPSQKYCRFDVMSDPLRSSNEPIKEKK
jgi:hypothetical protein